MVTKNRILTNATDRSLYILYTRLGASNSPTSTPPADRRPKNTKFSWKLRFTESAKLLRAAFGGLWDRKFERLRDIGHPMK